MDYDLVDCWSWNRFSTSVDQSVALNPMDEGDDHGEKNI